MRTLCFCQLSFCQLSASFYSQGMNTFTSVLDARFPPATRIFPGRATPWIPHTPRIQSGDAAPQNSSRIYQGGAAPSTPHRSCRAGCDGRGGGGKGGGRRFGDGGGVPPRTFRAPPSQPPPRPPPEPPPPRQPPPQWNMRRVWQAAHLRDTRQVGAAAPPQNIRGVQGATPLEKFSISPTKLLTSPDEIWLTIRRNYPTNLLEPSDEIPKRPFLDSPKGLSQR